MPKTPRLEINYPQENQNPWFSVFADFSNAIDSALYASREDRNFIIEGGGTITWNAGTNSLSWTQDIFIGSPYTGYSLTLPIAQSPITINLGQFLYVLVTRAPGAIVTLQARVSSVIPSTNDALLLAVRRGDFLYFRNGRGFDDGDTGPLYTTGASAPIIAFQRYKIAVGVNADIWVDEAGTAATQGALGGSGFTDAIFAPNSLDVFYETALCHYTAGAPGSTSEWTWVTTGSPAPVIKIGAGSTAGEFVTVKYPK